jgi:small neutral amino acid transporter SnatA (MarC family)
MAQAITEARIAIARRWAGLALRVSPANMGAQPGGSMITRILGVILAALAAQFIVDGLKQSFPALLA